MAGKRLAHLFACFWVLASSALSGAGCAQSNLSLSVAKLFPGELKLHLSNCVTNDLSGLPLHNWNLQINSFSNMYAIQICSWSYFSVDEIKYVARFS